MSSKMNNRIPLIALGLLLTFGLSNCKDDAVEEPIEYNFDDEFANITLEPLTETEPVAVESTEGDVTNSAAQDEAFAALENGTVTEDLKATTDTLASMLSEDEATALVDALKADTLTPEQEASLDALVASGALDSFLPTKISPTVDGETISARKATSPNTVVLLNLNEMLLGVSDECTDAADASFATAKAALDAAKASQDATINATYATAEASINTDYTERVTAIAEKWAAKKTSAETLAASMIAFIQANNLSIYFVLQELMILREKLADYIQGEEDDLKALGEKQDKALANAAAARDADLATSEANYNTSLNEATAIAAAIGNSCHNQGGSN